jgi:hypothetical protein
MLTDPVNLVDGEVVVIASWDRWSDPDIDYYVKSGQTLRIGDNNNVLEDNTRLMINSDKGTRMVY